MPTLLCARLIPENGRNIRMGEGQPGGNLLSPAQQRGGCPSSLQMAAHPARPTPGLQPAGWPGEKGGRRGHKPVTAPWVTQSSPSSWQGYPLSGGHSLPSSTLGAAVQLGKATLGLASEI